GGCRASRVRPKGGVVHPAGALPFPPNLGPLPPGGRGVPVEPRRGLTPYPCIPCACFAAARSVRGAEIIALPARHAHTSKTRLRRSSRQVSSRDPPRLVAGMESGRSLRGAR